MMNRPPPTGTPPAYARIPARLARGNLRPLMLVVCLFSAIWSIAAAVTLVKDRSDRNNSAKLDKVYLILAILYFLVGATELYGLLACFTQRIKLVRMYFFASVIVGVVVTGAELLRLVVHFIDKSDIINACVADQIADNTVGDTLTQAEAQDYCNGQWSRSTWFDIGLFILASFASFFFAALAASFLHQLVNPSVLRTHTAQLAPSSAYNYPLAPYPPQPYGAQQGSYPYGHGGGPEGGFVPPPYAPGGPPQYEGNGTPFGGDMKKEETNPFEESPNQGFAHRHQEDDSNVTVTLEPRRETEGRV